MKQFIPLVIADGVWRPDDRGLLCSAGRLPARQVAGMVPDRVCDCVFHRRNESGSVSSAQNLRQRGRLGLLGDYFIGVRRHCSSRDVEKSGVPVADGSPNYPWSGRYLEEGGAFWWLYEYIMQPITSTMFALLAFYVASAAFRAFRAKNAEALVLLLTAFIVLLSQTDNASGLVDR